VKDVERDEVIRQIDEECDLLIRKIAFNILHDYSAVDDVKQHVLIKCLRKTELLAKMERKQFIAYIATAAKNEAITEYRKKTVYENNKTKVVEAYTNNPGMDYVDFRAFEGKYGFSEEVWALLMELPQMDRDILVLTFYHSFTCAEVAEQLGTNREVVKKRLQRARAKLVKLIEKKGVELF